MPATGCKTKFNLYREATYTAMLRMTVYAGDDGDGDTGGDHDFHHLHITLSFNFQG